MRTYTLKEQVIFVLLNLGISWAGVIALACLIAFVVGVVK